MKKINFFLIFVLIFLFFFESANSNQELFQKQPKIFSNNDNYISEIGIDKYENFIWQNIFFDKSFEDIKSFVSNLPTKSSNAVVQDLVFSFLTSKKTLSKNLISKEQDDEIFQTLVDQLFKTGRLNEIELFYSESVSLSDNDFILKKMIEGNLLRNRHSEACKILENKVRDKPVFFGKIMIICDILNAKYEEAKLGLSLLKEQNNPGDIFFIDLAYSLMSEKNISESDHLKKNLDEIKELNPIIMASLQFADISPNFEQIANLSTSGLLFILSNPSVDTDLKIYCSEILAKQSRVSIEMLSEAYQLSRFENKDVENAFNLYKTLSPVKARPLLYQSILRDENPSSKYEKIIALLKISINDGLLSAISNLVVDLISFEKYVKTDADALLISKMYQSKKKFYEAKQILNGRQQTVEIRFREIALDLSQFLNKQDIDYFSLEKKLFDVSNEEKINVEDFNKIMMVLIVNLDLNQGISNIIKRSEILNIDKTNESNLKNLFLAEKYSRNKDFFNSMNVFFSILGNQDFTDLSLIENYSALLILKNLGFEKELTQLSESILL